MSFLARGEPAFYNSEEEATITMKSLFARLWREEEGQDLTEYALLLVLLALAAAAVLPQLATAINLVFTNATTTLTTTTTP